MHYWLHPSIHSSSHHCVKPCRLFLQLIYNLFLFLLYLVLQTKIDAGLQHTEKQNKKVSLDLLALLRDTILRWLCSFDAAIFGLPFTFLHFRRFMILHSWTFQGVGLAFFLWINETKKGPKKKSSICFFSKFNISPVMKSHLHLRWCSENGSWVGLKGALPYSRHGC